ncbi:uncharacterized protein C2845_PM11G01790 [Panicum miliaceum]|uniref:Uncharacterized protein n=1 Tax=Panicum miliaceum TaxID=4540 RepID=A0A3L6RU18_PANMI|nr:uncharacterized protein C2845_PM11G01790 [Panicum miliaceum]
MEKEEEHILNTLEWRGKGLIKSAYDIATDMAHLQSSVEANNNIEKVSLKEEHRPKLSHMICDIDGCLHEESVESLREAIATGVNVIMVTGKSRASIIRTFKLLDFHDIGDFVSETSPGVFLQGSLVYGRHGQEVYRAELDVDICKEAFLYSLKHKIPVVAYCEEQCLTLFEHPFVNLLHTVHHENKVKVMHSIEELLEYSSIQKLLLFDSAEEDSSVLRLYCSELTEGKARVLKMQPNTIDIVPLNATKGGDGLALLYECLVLLVLDITLAAEPFEGLFAITLLHGLGCKYTHLIGSWASSEDNSYSGPSSSSCNVLEDAEDGS